MASKKNCFLSIDPHLKVKLTERKFEFTWAPHSCIEERQIFNAIDCIAPKPLSFMTHCCEKLVGKVAIITGSSDGIGAAIAVEFCHEGAKVTINGRDEKKLKSVAEKCEAASPNNLKPLVICGDVTDARIRQQLVTDTVKTFGKIDILVNNAGYFRNAPIEKDEGMEPLDTMLDIHVRIPYNLIKMSIPQLVSNMGVIINISSIASFRPILPFPSMEYSIAKAGLDQLTQWMARELGPKGVRANTINPGCVKTNIVRASHGNENSTVTDEQLQQRWKKISTLQALKRMGNSPEIAKIAVFLASEDSSYITGAIVPADGGMQVMPSGPHTPVDI